MSAIRRGRGSSEDTARRLHQRLERAGSADQACRVAVRSLVSLLPVASAAAYVHDPRTLALELAAAHPTRRSDSWGSLAETVFSTGRSVSKRVEVPGERGRRRRRALYAAPLGVAGTPLGVLLVVFDLSRKPLKAHIETLRSHAALLGGRLCHLKAQSDLEAARGALGSVLNQLDDVWIGLDREGKIEFFSRFWREQVGRAPEELAGRHISEVYPAPPGYTWPGLWKALVDERRSLIFHEFDYVSPVTGKKMALDADVRPRVDDAGNVTGVLLHVRPVQELKQLRLRAQASEERYRQLFEGIHVPVAVFRMLDERPITWNRQFEDLTGYTKDELAARTVADFVHPEDLPKVRERFRARLEGRQVPDVYEIRGIAADGVVHDLVIYIQPYDEDGKMVGALVAMLDITERKAAERSLVGRNRQLAALNKIIGAVSQTLDLDGILHESLKCVVEVVRAESGGIYLRSNNTLRLAALLGIPEEAMGEHATIEIGKRWVGSRMEGPEAVWITDHSTAAGGPGEKGKARLPEGPLAQVNIRSKGKTIGVIVLLFSKEKVLSDTERDLLRSAGNQIGVGIENARLYREVREANEALQGLHEMKDEFLSTVSHELKAPLTSIQGATDLILMEKEGEITPGQRRFLGLIRGNADRLNRLIHDLLDLSRIDAGFQEARPKNAGVASLVRDALESMRPQSLEKNITLEMQDLVSIPKVKMVVDRIRQVLTNLISNAIRFTPGGGRVWIDGRVENHEVVVGVHDTGIGIPPEFHEKVFERFLQVAPAAFREGGTGLGLTISKKIVEAHGGRMWVESLPGAGSHFYFTLPLK